MTKKRQDKTWRENVCVFILFLASLLAVAVFHEPWYDEAQAWQIAKCASFSDILFTIPHYEGHPPLWHLLLAIPAKLGVPYEIGLKGVSLLGAALSGFLLLFFSPFPRVVRYLLPFHYFFFYQYGVVSRPYSMMGCTLLLLAMAFPRRNERPWRFVLLLSVLCLLSAYGIVLAGGIAAAWCLEILRERKWDGRIPALFFLLLLAVMLLAEISPRPDTVIAFAGIGRRIPYCLLYTFFLVLPDSSVMTIFQGEGILRYSHFPVMTVAIGILMGTAMLLFLSLLSSKKKLPYFWIPYVFLSLFSAVVYFAVHHMGIAFLFTVFWLWIQTEEQDCFETGRWVGKHLFRGAFAKENWKRLTKLGPVAVGLLLGLPVLWTLFAGVLEVRNPYFYGREAAAFLKEHHMEEADIMTAFSCPVLELDGEAREVYDLEKIYEEMNVSVAKLPVAILPYFDRNIVRNFNMGEDDKGYVLYRVPSKEENRSTVEKWSESGPPEVILGPMNLWVIFGEEVSQKDYSPVYCMHPLRINIWKLFLCGEGFGEEQYIYVRRDCMEKYGVSAMGGWKQ